MRPRTLGTRLGLSMIHPCIVANDLPKVAALKRPFADDCRAKPVLVGSFD